MNATAASVSDFFATLFSNSVDAASLSVITPLLLGNLAAVSIMICVLYTFYPAILAARQPTLEPCRVEVLHQQGSNSNKAASTLSIIIPAFNEQERLPKMLHAAVDYLSSSSIIKKKDNSGSNTQQHQNKALRALECTNIEWIVVSDGSVDDTETVFRDFVTAWAIKNSRSLSGATWTWKLLVLPQNVGKGAAVKTGMLHASGAWRLMVDADGATDFGPGLEALAQYASSNDVVIGSRAHLQKTIAAKKRSVVRQALMHAFQFLCVVLVGATEIQDTQCGFKLFTSSAASKLFGNLHLRGWAFDTELIYMVVRFRMKIKEVLVPWREVDGSKLNTSAFNLAIVAITMLRDMVCVRLCYILGLWSVRVRQARQAPKRNKGSVSVMRKRRKED